MLRDRFSIRKTIQSLRRRPDPDRLKRLAQTLETSTARRQQRLLQLPNTDLDPSLPITEHADEIIQTLQEHQTIVVAGETGSGKSTQLPKLCLRAGFGVSAMIGHTQPRRIAARSVAARIADEMKATFGREVGFKIRFTDKTDPLTYIKLMTDGILLAETQRDRFLEDYDVIILDEAHERSLNIDFLLGYLHRLLQKRKDLRLVITSATLDADRFAKHFSNEQGPAPVISVSGRTYPVDVLYRPPLPSEEGDIEQTQTEAVLSALDDLLALERGDILIFLPTERDIRETAKTIRAYLQRHPREDRTQVLPLYARLSVAEQNKIFQTGPHRRIVLATNVAESSLTVPGIRYVIDTGTARISRYSPRLKVQRLPIEAISRASADQRKGRCGRIAPGVCIRTYSEEDYLAREEFTTPEIRRTNLASVILQAKVLKLGSVDEIPFVDPPRPDAVREGYKTLFELSAVDDRRNVTKLGRQLARFPVDPRIARMILAGHNEGCLNEILIIVAALEIQDPRERPHERRQAADLKHAQFLNERSDFLSYLAIWDFYHALRDKLSRNQLRKACQQNFLSANRMFEWLEIYRQLRQVVTSQGISFSSNRDHATIHRALLPGLLSGVARRTSEHEYTGAGGVKFHLWPGSGLFQRRPEWIVTAEIVETNRRYGRTVAAINPSWIEPIASHLLKHHLSDPHWHVKSETVMAYERVSLFGLPIVQKRRIRYGSHDPKLAREIFIQRALVEKAIRSDFRFLQHNQDFLQQMDQQAAKTRRREFLIDEYAQFAFYNQRLPNDVFDVASLRRWLRKAASQRNERLSMKLEDFIEPELASQEDSFPEQIELGSFRAPVRYNFQPGTENDGITMTIPAEGIHLIDRGTTDWLVPGLVTEKVIALIRSLPKNIRRNLVPAPETARQVVNELKFGEGDFLEQVARRLSQIAEMPISPNDFQLESLQPHLSMNFEVIGADGTPIVTGRDLDRIRKDLVSSAPPSANADGPADSKWHRDGMTSFDLDELPEQVVIDRGGIPVTMYPALVDNGQSVDLRLFSDRSRARHEFQFGLMRLLALAQRKSLKSHVRWLPSWDRAKVHASPLFSGTQLDDMARDLIALRSVLREKPLPRTPSAFTSFLERSGESLGIAAQEVATLFAKTFGAYHEVRLGLEERTSQNFQHAIDSIEQQLQALFYPQFLVRTPFVWLTRYPCYLEAILIRLEKLRTGLQRDKELTEEIESCWQRYCEKRQSNEAAGIYDRELEEYRWMLEEYRVSLFAQSLGTAVKISPQRMEKQWSKVR